MSTITTLVSDFMAEQGYMFDDEFGRNMVHDRASDWEYRNILINQALFAEPYIDSPMQDELIAYLNTDDIFDSTTYDSYLQAVLAVRNDL